MDALYMKVPGIGTPVFRALVSSERRPEIGSEAWMREQVALGRNPSEEMDRIPRPGDGAQPFDRRY